MSFIETYNKKIVTLGLFFLKNNYTQTCAILRAVYMRVNTDVIYHISPAAASR